MLNPKLPNVADDKADVGLRAPNPKLQRLNLSERGREKARGVGERE